MKNINFEADDFGYTNVANKEIIRLYNAGRIRIFAVMADFVEKTPEIIEFLKDKPVALHVNLIEGQKYSPLPLFVIKLFMGLIDLKWIEDDIQKQIDIVNNLGSKVVELNTHQHTGALSPISEILIRLAKKNNISNIRNYNKAEAQTIRAKFCLLLLKTTALLSVLRFKLKIGLPDLWQDNICRDKALPCLPIYFMSWEDRSFSMDKLPKDKNIEIVTHPGTNFDKNNDYEKYF